MDERTPVNFLVGSFVAAVGLGTVAAAAAQLAGLPDDTYLSMFGVGCGAPLVLAVLVFFRLLWRAGESAARVAEMEAEARLARAAPVATPSPEPAPAEVDENERAWALSLERFFRAGDQAGSFSINALSGVVGSDVWGRMTDFYCSEAGNRVLRIAPGNVGTVWGWGWQLDTVLQRVALRLLPHPTGPAPDVQPYVQNTTQRRTPRKSTKEVRVIDGQAKQA